MNLLPKTDGKFAEKEYWDKFFKDNKEFEWYGEYPELCGILHRYMRANDNILVVGCGNSKISSNLYDVGFKNILNIDISPIVVKQMRHLNRERTQMRFQVCDALNTGLPSDSYSVVLDKGTLDALMPQSDVEDIQRGRKLINEVGRVLKVGGRYIIISLLQEHILKTLLEEFSNLGWLLRILRCHDVEEKTIQDVGYLRMPVFLIVATKFKKLPNCHLVLELGLTKDGVLNRKTSIEDVQLDVKEVQDCVAMCFQMQHQKLTDEMKMEYKRPSEMISRYTIYILDGEGSQSFGVFIVPPGREIEWLFATKEGRATLQLSSEYQRLAVVALHRDHTYESIQSVQDELSPNILQLAPKGHKGMIPYLTIGSDLNSRAVKHRGCSDFSGEFIVEDVDVDNSRVRRLVFLGNQAVVQSEVKMTRKGKHWKVDHTHLACTHHCYMAICAALSINETLKILILGLGGGCLASFIHRTFPNTVITGIDIDSDIIRTANQYFNLQPTDRLIVKVEDAIQYLEQNNNQQYDLIILDIDNKQSDSPVLSPPPQFLQTSVLKKIKQSLTNSGIFVTNVLSRLESEKKTIENTIRTHFQFVFRCHLDEDVNEIFYASNVNNLSYINWKEKLLKSAQDLINQANNSDIIDIDHFARVLNFS